MTATSKDEMGNHAFASAMSKSRTVRTRSATWLARSRYLQVMMPMRLTVHTHATQTVDWMVRTAWRSVLRRTASGPAHGERSWRTSGRIRQTVRRRISCGPSARSHGSHLVHDGHHDGCEAVGQDRGHWARQRVMAFPPLRTHAPGWLHCVLLGLCHLAALELCCEQGLLCVPPLAVPRLLIHRVQVHAGPARGRAEWRTGS